jgi:hypothetical protein
MGDVMVPEKGLVKLGRWPAGINNMAEEVALDRDNFGRIIALAEADNIDLSAEGIAKRRKGQILVDDQPYHSLYCDQFPFGLCVTGGKLHRLDENGAITELVDGLSPFLELTYAELSDRIFWSDGSRQGMVMRDATTREMGVEVPSSPILSVTSGGLGQGTYQVVLTFRNQYGERSGTEEPIEIDVPTGGGIVVSGIPTPTSPEIAAVEVFVTGGNETFYRAGMGAPGTSEIRITSAPQGFRLDTLMLDRTPPATIYRIHNGRLVFASGRYVGWSKALRPTLWDGAKDYLRFAAPPTMIESISASDASGLFVAAGGRTFWMAGADPLADGGWKSREVHPYGAVEGSSLLVPAKAFDPDAAPTSRYAYWLDTGGHFCLGKPGGVVERIGPRRFNAGVAERAASVFRERDGQRHVITSLRGSPMQDSIRMGDSLGVVLVKRAGQ